MRTLVTGATGYLGSRLVRRLVALGHEVHVVARPTSDLALLGGDTNSVKVHRVTDSFSSVLSAVESSRPDVVFHLASLFLAQHRSEDIAPLVSGNVLFGAHVVEAMSCAGVSRLVLAGTASIHSDHAEYDP